MASVRESVWSLRRQGLDALTAGNLAALELGLRPAASGWSEHELAALLALRWAREHGRLDPMADVTHSPDGPVLLRTRAGRYHRGVVLDGDLKTGEGCNLDDSPAEVVIGSLEDAEPGSLCERCFGRDIEGAPI